jgi:hypothetical protein
MVREGKDERREQHGGRQDRHRHKGCRKDEI